MVILELKINLNLFILKIVKGIKQMNKKRFAVISVMICLIFIACVSVTAATSTAVQSSTNSATHGNKDGAKCKGLRAGHNGMKQLSQLTGISIDDLHTKYPQKTSWQIALQLGKLDSLKSAVLADHKKMLEQLVKDGIITSVDSTKMFADLQKRVIAIDGKNTVILGKPSYMPKFKDGANGHHDFGNNMNSNAA
jgi:hypothetical protein